MEKNKKQKIVKKDQMKEILELAKSIKDNFKGMTEDHELVHDNMNHFKEEIESIKLDVSLLNDVVIIDAEDSDDTCVYCLESMEAAQRISNIVGFYLEQTDENYISKDDLNNLYNIMFGCEANFLKGFKALMKQGTLFELKPEQISMI